MKVHYLAPEIIQKKVDEFCDLYPRANTIPVDVEKLIEIDLKLQIIPIASLKPKCDTDALLSNDLRSVLVDLEQFVNEKNLNRLRFTFAHEIGHLILHSDLFKLFKFSSVDDWISTFNNFEDKLYKDIEFQANEFAGRLLIPPNKLIEVVNQMQDKIEMWKNSTSLPVSNNFIEYIARTISQVFGVSQKVAQIRIEKEKIFKELFDN